MRHTVNNKFEKREGVRVRNSHANYYYPFTHISKVHLSLRIVAQGNTVAALEGTGASLQLSPTQLTPRNTVVMGWELKRKT